MVVWKCSGLLPFQSTQLPGQPSTPWEDNAEEGFFPTALKRNKGVKGLFNLKINLNEIFFKDWTGFFHVIFGDQGLRLFNLGLPAYQENISGRVYDWVVTVPMFLGSDWGQSSLKFGFFNVEFLFFSPGSSVWPVFLGVLCLPSPANAVLCIYVCMNVCILCLFLSSVFCLPLLFHPASFQRDGSSL